MATHAEQHHIARQRDCSAKLGRDQDATRAIHIDVTRAAQENPLPCARRHRPVRDPLAVLDGGTLGRDELPALLDKYRDLFLQAEVTTQDELEEKVIRRLTQLGFAEDSNGIYRFLPPMHRFLDVCLSVQQDSDLAASLHGQPISNEFIHQADPDILYVIDRTAVMERRPALNAQSLSNPLLRQTKAWKNGRVVFVDAQAWYVTAASPTSLRIVVDDVLKGYQP